MDDFFAEKQKKGKSAFAAIERDVPFDAEYEREESRFARFYLEQQNQQSNIYFMEHQRERAAQVAQAAQRRHAAEQAPLISRFSFLWRLAGIGALSGALIFSFLGTAWWWSGGVKTAPVFSVARGAYADILSAQQAFAQFDFEKSMFLLYAAHERMAQREQGSRALAAYAQNTLAFLLHRGESGSFDASALEREILDAAEKFAQGMEPLFQLSAASFFHTKNTQERAAAGELMSDALLGVLKANAVFDNAQEAVAAAEERGVLEDAYAQSAALAPQLSLASARAKQLAVYLKLAVWALGVERPRKFILVAQDSAIARPTGGAIRSVGVITAQGGVITNIAFDDVYGVDGQLQVNVVPPEPIQKAATAWALHDANWFLHFPLSAKKIAYFYEKSGGGDIDGVIALNERAVKKILTLTGPVKGDDGVSVNSENHGSLVRKDILRALAEVLPTFSGDNTHMLMRTIQESLREKDIILWLAARDHQEIIVKEGWSGEIIGEEGADYLAVASSDVGTDAMTVKEDVWKETHIAESGEIINTVAVQFVPENGIGAQHERYVRIYVPRGSELLETSGFSAVAASPHIDYVKERFIVDEDLAASERAARSDALGVRIFEESRKTVFGGWVTIGEKNATVIVRYRLPFLFTKDATRASMAFIFQKQPGISVGINFSLLTPEGMRAVDQEGNDLLAFFADGSTDVIIRAIIK